MSSTSFSSLQKQEIINQQNKSVCCRRALLDGVLAAKGRCADNEIHISLESPKTCEYISSYILEFYGHAPTVSRAATGGRGLTVTFKSNSAAKYISNLRNDISFSDVCKQKCSSCHSAFWRGVFLSSGRASNPEKQYSLEFSLGERAELFFRLFTEQDFKPRLANRRAEKLIYFKSGEALESFFALAGMNKTVFSVIYAKINREGRNSANRISNCETRNITRAVDASQRHQSAINDLIEANMLSSLPDELEKTARLRIQNSSLSLSQLASVAVPPITKSGLSHRLNKIVQYAEQKLGKKYT